ncbi:hypothetical protein D3C73_593810 [compost metagenome]
MNPLMLCARLFILAVCLLMAGHSSADGTISFSKENNVSCTFRVPPTGSGATWQYELAGNKERCEDNNQDFIVFTGLPSATRIVLTDSPTCDTEPGEENGFVFIIKTTKKMSTTPQRIQMHHLGDYAEDKIFHPGFLMVTKKLYKQAQIHSRLSCLQITVSSEKIMPDKDVVVTPDTEWSAGQVEIDSDYTCEDNKFLVGRIHYQDRQGKTQYLCATAGGLPAYTLTDRVEEVVRETNSYYMCPKNKIMTGRKYQWVNDNAQEIDRTTYRCATLKNADGDIVNQVRGQWSEPVKERDSTTSCEPGQVMVGRAHTGDHEGHTRIRCATLHNTPATP